jgi:23S rRNA (cytidine1920-2'-O)/16S rRNA (cytidine1409-2'-O)-methyltransferase
VKKKRPAARKQRDAMRLDRLLVERGLAPDAAKAAALIMVGDVQVDGGRVRTPSAPVRRLAEITMLTKAYVSRGGHKLEGALDDLKVEVKGQTILDAGSSTGGFTDCVLQRGAERVHAVDVGYGLLAWKVRNDARVTLHERTHINDVDLERLGGPVDLVVADLSFISLARVLPNLGTLVPPGGPLLVLVKPQFEAEFEDVPEGGVIRDEAVRQRIVDEVADEARELGFTIEGEATSRLAGTEGNVEVFLLLRSPPEGTDSE